MARYKPYNALTTLQHLVILSLTTSHSHFPPRGRDVYAEFGIVRAHARTGSLAQPLTLTRPLQAFLWSIPLLDEPASVHEYYARETVRARRRPHPP